MWSLIVSICTFTSSYILVNATVLGLAYLAARGIGAICELKQVVILQYPICLCAVSDMYMSVFGKDAPDSLYVLLCRYI